MHANNWRHFFFLLKKTKTILRTHDVQAASVKRQMAALTNTLGHCVDQIIYVCMVAKNMKHTNAIECFPPKCSMEPISCIVNQVKVNLPGNCSTCSLPAVIYAHN